MPKWFNFKKKFIQGYIILAGSFFIQLQSAAQKKLPEETGSLFRKYADTTVSGFSEKKSFYIISPNELIPKNITVIRSLAGNTSIVQINSPAAYKLLNEKGRVITANDNWKFSPAAEKNFTGKKNDLQQYIITGVQTNMLLAVLKDKSNDVTVLSVDEPSHSVLIKAKIKFVVNHLLPLKEIIFIDVRIEPTMETRIIGYNRSFHGINRLDYTIPGANGKNIVAGVKEQKMDEADLDLYKRVLSSSIAAAATENHATVISSIIGGAGNGFYDGRGIANGCKFFPSSFVNLFADDAAILNTNKVTVQNHSYGTIIQQFYGAEAVSYDAQTWSNKNVVHVFSVGNRGTSFATDGQYANITGYANLTGNFKMAKNIITVGAIDNRGNIPAESSAGPVYDGRVAPQLTALGPNGTSDAAAVVSGTIAVMQQVYADSNNQTLPPASLIKAILYNTAEDIYNTGIDYKTGYGLLNSFAAVKAIQQKKYEGSTLTQSGQWTKNINVPANTAELKITIAWTDTAASVNNNKALINDLDLEVKELSSDIVYKPWVLNASPNIDSLKKGPIRKRDSLNTAEQVSIQLPAAGLYQIKVTGTAIANSSVPFHIAYNTDTLNTFVFTNPQHASDVNRVENENLDIRWKTFVADTNTTGNLFISYSGGANWLLLKAAHKIYSNQFVWPIKDTNTRAILKMETSFGNFLSSDFIISKLTRLNVNFLCTDSFQLSWNKHIYAGGYKIFMLTDSPYLKPVRTVTDTFAVFSRLVYPSLVYAVEPLLSNSIPAARSVAVDINLQGVKCFYKTIYYNVLDGNQLDLVVELSAPDYADSVFFEKVSAAGLLLQTYGGAKAIDTKNIYNRLITDVPAGTIYLRARIKLKSGAIVYTEIISVLTSGKQYILFYPNPVRRSDRLNYILLQGIPAGSRLQLFDINGGLLKNFSTLPDRINVSAFVRSMIIYKLMNSEGVVLETGKLVIQ
jgi:Subtilase family